MNNYERIGLYPHNIKTCKKISKAYDEGTTIVSIIHATGTGKTYIGEFLSLENKDKKIVWLVPTNAIKEHIEKTINENPNLNIESDFPNLEIRTYSSLINLSEEELPVIPCDLLIVDELHHLGAPVWGEKVKQFIEQHNNIKIFGMTAYNVRDRGTSYERDMVNPETEEIFSNTVESVYDVYDAIIDGILPKPITKSVITENSETITEIKEKIELLKKKNDYSYLEYEKMIEDIIKIIHKQNGVKELVKKTVKPDGKYIYFCPVVSEEGKNDINSIMDTMREYLEEKFESEKIIFYKSTSADGEYGKYNRDCFYHDIDLNGNDAKNKVKIIFVKNQYNEGVHAPNVDGVFLGRRTKSDIVAFEQIGRALSVRGNIHAKIEEYSNYTKEELIKLATIKGIIIKEDYTKEVIIEKLISPVIIDLADNIEYIEELENNLKERIKEIQDNKKNNPRTIKIIDSNIDIEITNKELFDILKEIRSKLSSKTWDDWYQLASSFYEQHKHSEIPERFKTVNGYDFDASGVNLGVWCRNQRYNKDKLTEEHRKKLEAIEFRFERNHNEKTWDDWYSLAAIYYKKYGDSEIPHRFKTVNGYDFDASGVCLGIWCANQRKYQNNLSHDRQKKLKAIKFRFKVNSNNMTWEDWYQLAYSFYEQNKHSDIPYNFKTLNGYDFDESGVRLGQWIINQRRNSKTLTEDKKQKLELINFRFEKNSIEMTWEEWYQLAASFYEQHKHSEITRSFKTSNGHDFDEFGFKLGQWCDRQRSKQNKLTPDQRKKLEAIQFRFEVISKKNNMDWEKWYNLAKLYYEKHKHSNIPNNFKTTNGYDFDASGVKLGQWCTNQRRNSKKLSKDQREKLEKIHFRLETKNTNMEWIDWYQLAVNYYNKYGNSEIPQKFKTTNGYDFNEFGVNLGMWCNMQRNKKSKLTEDKIQKLELIEFRFITKKEAEEKKIDLCKTYSLNYEKYEILKRMSYQELYAKISFLIDNNYSLEINDDIHEIFYMSNENMILKYIVSKEELITKYSINKKKRGV